VGTPASFNDRCKEKLELARYGRLCGGLAPHESLSVGQNLGYGKEFEMNLRGTEVVIIGGSSGMGFATAKLAKEREATVTIVSRSREKLQRAAKKLGSTRTMVADITHEPDIQALFEDMERVDHVFVSAARPLFGRLLEAELETLRSDVDQRFWGAVYVVRHAAPKMRQGSITFITGTLSSKPSPGAIVTSAMHSAVETLAKGLALDLAPVRVNAIAPGTIDTPAYSEEGRRAAMQWAKDNLPVKRMGTAEEVAQAALLLMTNHFITGEVLHVDGGSRWI
jgi:NAD(P)-dependent dehydrogenase (short-subunit alcohol dehydrogenase family)